MNPLYIECKLPRLVGGPNQGEWWVGIQSMEKDWSSAPQGAEQGGWDVSPGRVTPRELIAPRGQHWASVLSRGCSGSAKGPLGAGVLAQGVTVCQGRKRMRRAKPSPGQRALQTPEEGIREPETMTVIIQADL